MAHDGRQHVIYALNRALDAIVARFGMESIGRGGTARSEKGLTTRLKRGE